MAPMQIEIAASSSAFSYISLKDHSDHKRAANIMGYVNSQRFCKNTTDEQDEDTSWLPSQNLKMEDSWLPTISGSSTVTLESKGSHHRKVENNVDNSWLPTVNDSDGRCGTNRNESENGIDYSWLPSTFIDSNKSIQKKDIINMSMPTKIKTKSTNTSINKRNTKNSSNSNNNNSKSNSNSNNNSSPQKKSRNDHWALARKVVFSCDQPNQNAMILRKTTSDSSHLQQRHSPSRSRYVMESPTSGGVSSLLQRWKDLVEVKNSKISETLPSSNRSSSGSKCKENSPPTSSIIKDSHVNLGADDASRSRRLSCPLPCRDSKDSNPGGAEKEKIRVVDIIKKLSREEELAASHAVGHGNHSLPPIQTTLHHKQFEGGHKDIKNIKVSRRLLRGRQAFDMFLMQKERDKHRELKWLVERRAVSKFSHRGRIQSLLRFKILRLEVEPKPESKIHRSCISKPLESNIMDLRERFNSEIKKGVTESRNHKRHDLKNITNEESPATTSTVTRMMEIKTKNKTTTSNKKQEPQPKPESMTLNKSTQRITSCKDVMHKTKFVDTCSSPIMHKEDQHYKQYKNDDDDDDDDDFYEDEGQFMSPKLTVYSQMEDRGMQTFESFHDWMSTSEYSQTHSDWDEDESYDMQLFDTEYDWISAISRPKSDWEDMRQARYQEMLHHSSGKIDIQRLLERKTVSSFLGSSMRDLIDQLMVSRIQQSHAQLEKQDVVVREKEDSRKQVEHEDGLMVDDNEDYRNKSETKCSEYNTCEYAHQTSYSERSWRPNDIACNTETTTTTTTTSPSIEHSLSSNHSQNNSTPKSSPAIAQKTIEMELIYDLRGHMEQLHNEIMELRKSIKSCVNMQVKLQHSLKQNVIATEPSSVQMKERRPSGIVEHKCSICYDMQVDSLLYRCGHMCTCYECGLELQRASEECPVCEAPIVDVVKACVHKS